MWLHARKPIVLAACGRRAWGVGVMCAAVAVGSEGWGGAALACFDCLSGGKQCHLSDTCGSTGLLQASWRHLTLCGQQL